MAGRLASLRRLPFFAGKFLRDLLNPLRYASNTDDAHGVRLGRYYLVFDEEELKRSINSYHVAYIVRAVTPGSFALPATNVSDMYAPRIHGRTAMGRVEIAPR